MRPYLHSLGLLCGSLSVACGNDGGSESEAEAEAEAESESESEGEAAVLFVYETELQLAQGFADLFNAGYVGVASIDDAIATALSPSLLIVGPDTSVSTSDAEVLRDLAPRVLAMGEGGNIFFGRLGSPLANASCGEVGAIGIADPSHPIFDGIESDGTAKGDFPLLEVFDSNSVFDCGVLSGDADITYLAWDYRFDAEYADIAFEGDDWWWGFGDATTGTAADLTDKGEQLFRQLVEYIAAP